MQLSNQAGSRCRRSINPLVAVDEDRNWALDSALPPYSDASLAYKLPLVNDDVFIVDRILEYIKQFPRTLRGAVGWRLIGPIRAAAGLNDELDIPAGDEILCRAVQAVPDHQ